MKVLLAIDGSPHSDAAITEVAGRHWRQGTVIEILTVVHSPLPAIIDPALVLAAARVDQLDAQRRQAETMLSEAAERLRGSTTSATVTTKILEGNPGDVIVEEANRWGADLIIVGSHGYGRLRRMILGSVAQAVVNNARCSVHVVRDRHAFDDTVSAA